MKPSAVVGILLILGAAGASLSAQAQLKGSHLLGFSGLNAGTQGPPGINVIVLPMYLYSAGKLKDGSGNTLTDDVDLTSYANGIGPAWVTNVKVLGANLGGSILIPFLKNTIEASRTDVKTNYSFSDIFVQPVQLGWHRKSADFLASYQMYIPTGRYEVGGDDNAGLGQWAHEFTAGATVKFGAQKTFHVSTAVSYELNGKKKDSELRTGNNLSLEGGLGHTWYKKGKGPIPTIINGGLIYYMQFKTTDDEIPPVDLPVIGPTALNLKKDHIYGLGVEGNIFIPAIKSAIVMRWLGEFGATTRFQGNTYILMWVYNLKSLAHHEK